MNVLEIKNNLVKISYEAQDDLTLSSFVIIEDTNTPYVAQVMNLKADKAGNVAVVKLLFTFNEDGILKNYNGSIPSLKAVVSKLPSNELLDIIPVEEPLILGKLAQQNTVLKVDKTILDNNLLICSNNLNNTTVLLDNITSQLQEKVVIFDTEGQFEQEQKLVFGRDFKLPLNSQTINFIYENDLDDVDATSKAIIQDVFLELQQYTETLPEKFLPFDTFIDVVDAQYRETNITQLILLKNKLLKYKELNVFAQTLKDILDLSIAVENSNITIIDIANIPANLQQEVLKYIYSVLNKINQKIYAFAKIDNSIINKKLLKLLIQRNNVYTTVICPHELKYISELKEIAQNIIFYTPQTLQNDFASYNVYLNKLNNDEFIIYGAHTQNIPFIVELSDIYNIDSVKEDNSKTQTNETSINEEFEENNDDEIFEETIETTDNLLEDSDKEIDDETKIMEEPEILDDNIVDKEFESLEEPEILDKDEIIEDNLEPIDESELVDENIIDVKIEPLEEPEILDNEILTEGTEQNNDEIIEQVAKDVDKVFYEKISEEDLEEPELAGDELTEDDLDLIDDLSVEEDNEDEIIETEPLEEEPPVVPIYPADDIEEKAETFERGDTVSSPKFGAGIVERMVPYGNKTLCSINFKNVGRRLLDPAVTEIRKVK